MMDKCKAKFIKFLEKVAEDVAPVSNARIAAALVYNREIISIGVNQKKSHPFQRKFTKNEHAIFLHAETDAIKNALKKYDIETIAKSTLFICRMKKDEITGAYIRGLARPCVGCLRAIATFNIKKVYYTTDGEDINTL
jgi:deoxycytidylate deaminase